MLLKAMPGCCADRIRRSDSVDSALGPKLQHAAWMQNIQISTGSVANGLVKVFLVMGFDFFHLHP